MKKFKLYSCTILLFWSFCSIFADIDPALEEAVRQNNVASVKTRLAAGANVNAKSNEGATVLMMAAEKGHAEVVKALLVAGADVKAKNKDGVTALMFAAQNGHEEVAKVLLAAGADVKAKNKDGVTALMAAAQKGHAEVVKVLLAAGADVHAKKKYGYTVLMLAAQNGRAEVVKVLLAAGADVKAKSEDGRTALWLATLYRRAEVVKVLQAAEADVNAKTATALMAAVQEGHAEIVKNLLAAGANANAKNNKGVMALRVAVQEGHTEVVKALLAAGAYFSDNLIAAAEKGDTEVVKVLLAAGADVHAKDKNGKTALIVATEKGDTEIIKALLAASTDAHNKAEDSGMALMLVVQNDHAEIVKVLLAAGADVHAKDKDGITALMFAAYKGHAEVVKALLVAGADVKAKNKDGVTALMFAAQNGHEEVAKVLLAAGADVNAKTNNGMTALMLAVDAEQKNINCVKILLDVGALVDLSDSNLQDCMKKTTPEIIKLLHQAANSPERLYNLARFCDPLIEKPEDKIPITGVPVVGQVLENAINYALKSGPVDSAALIKAVSLYCAAAARGHAEAAKCYEEIIADGKLYYFEILQARENAKKLLVSNGFSADVKSLDSRTPLPKSQPKLLNYIKNSVVKNFSTSKSVFDAFRILFHQAEWHCYLNAKENGIIEVSGATKIKGVFRKNEQRQRIAFPVPAGTKVVARFQVRDSSAVLTDYKLSAKHPILGEMTNIEFHRAAESNEYEQSQKEGNFWEFVYE